MKTVKKIDPFRVYRCTILGEDVRGEQCESRQVKAGIAQINPRFSHRMTEAQLAGCIQCRAGVKGLVGPGRKDV